MFTKKQLLRRIICYYIQIKNIKKISEELQIKNYLKKKVSFSNKNSLILIPTRQDYKNYGLHNELWWQPTDYLHFKSEAKEEVTILMKLNNMDVKSAIHHLYQPHNSCRLCVTDTYTSFNSIPLFISKTENCSDDLSSDNIPMFVNRDIHSPPKPNQRKEFVHPLALMANGYC